MKDVQKIAVEITSRHQCKSTKEALDVLKKEYGIEPGDNANHMYGDVTTGMYE